MKHLLCFLVACALAASAVSSVSAQTLIRVHIFNRSQQSLYLIAYDPTCRIRVFEAVLKNSATTTVRVCADDRGRGNLVIYDVRGRSLKFGKLRNGSNVNIRFR